MCPINLEKLKDESCKICETFTTSQIKCLLTEKTFCAIKCCSVCLEKEELYKGDKCVFCPNKEDLIDLVVGKNRKITCCRQCLDSFPIQEYV